MSQLTIDEIVIENIDLLEAALHKLKKHLYVSVAGGSTSGSIILIPRNKDCGGSVILVNDTVDRHFHNANDCLKRLTLETESLTREQYGKVKGIEKHLVEKFNHIQKRPKVLAEHHNTEKQPTGFKYLPG